MAAPAPVDFIGSAKRHMRDAELLETNNRRANCGQLLGFVAECGIKAVMIWLGYPTDPQGSPTAYRGQPTNLREHINILQGQIPTIAGFAISISGRAGAKYVALIPNVSHFANWSVDHRYYREASIPNSFADWKAAAREVMTMLDQAIKDGMT